MSTKRAFALVAFLAVVASALLWIWLASEKAGRTNEELTSDADGSRGGDSSSVQGTAREQIVTREAPPPIASTAAPSVFGRVVDPSGAPVSAKVEAIFLRRRETSRSEAIENASITAERSAQAGVDGAFRIELGSALAHHVLLSIAMPGLARFRACFACSPTGMTDLGTIALQRGGRVFGKAVCSDGGAPAEVGIEWTRLDADHATCRRSDGDGCVRSDPHGAFEIADLPTGVPIHLRVRDATAVSAWSPRIEARPNEEVGPIVLKYSRGVVLRGRVTDVASGVGVPARIKLWGHPSELRLVTSADAAGQFAFPGLEDGRQYGFEARCEGYYRSSGMNVISLVNGLPDRSFEIALRHMPEIALRVLDARGNAVAGARAFEWESSWGPFNRLSTEDPDQGLSGRPLAVTDAEGRARFGRHRSTERMIVQADGFVPQVCVIDVSKDELVEQTVQLDTGRSLEVQLTGEELFALRIGALPNLSWITTVNNGEDVAAVVDALAHARERFSDAEGRVRWEGLPGGTQARSVVLWCEGSMRYLLGSVALNGYRTIAEMSIPERRFLPLAIEDASGLPVSWRRALFVRRVDRRRPWAMALDRSDPRIPHGGEFVVWLELEEGSSRRDGFHSFGRGEIREEGGERYLLRLKGTEQLLQGRVSWNGQPLGGAFVSVSPSVEGWEPSDSPSQVSCWTDYFGGFRVPFFGAAIEQINVSEPPRPGAFHHLGIWRNVTPPTQGVLELDIAGAVVNLELQATDGSPVTEGSLILNREPDADGGSRLSCSFALDDHGRVSGVELPSGAYRALALVPRIAHKGDLEVGRFEVGVGGPPIEVVLRLPAKR